jgi:ribose transport system permease protein
VLLNHTRLGAHLYAVGANYYAARLNGVPVDRVLRTGLVIMSTLAALTAVIAMGRGSQTLLYGTTITGFDLTTTLTAVLLGGVSLFGGSGRIERNFVALLFLTIMANGLGLLGISSGVWLIGKAVIRVAALLLDVARQRAA